MENETVHSVTSLESKVHALDFPQATASVSTASPTPAKYEYVPFRMVKTRVVCCSLLWNVISKKDSFLFGLCTSCWSFLDQKITVAHKH